MSVYCRPAVIWAQYPWVNEIVAGSRCGGPWMKSLGNRRSRGLPSAWLRCHPSEDDSTVPYPVKQFLSMPVYVCLRTERNYQG